MAEEKKGFWDKIKDSFKDTADAQKNKMEAQKKQREEDKLFQDDMIIEDVPTVSVDQAVKTGSDAVAAGQEHSKEANGGILKPVENGSKPSGGFIISGGTVTNGNGNKVTPSGGGSNGVIDLIGGNTPAPKPKPKPKPMEKTEAEKAKERLDAAKKQMDADKASYDKANQVSEEAYKKNQAAKSDYEAKKAAADKAAQTNKAINDKYDEAAAEASKEEAWSPQTLKKRNEILQSLGLEKLGIFATEQDFQDAIEKARQEDLRKNGADEETARKEADDAKKTYDQANKEYKDAAINGQEAHEAYDGYRETPGSKQAYEDALRAYEKSMQKGVEEQTKDKSEDIRNKIKEVGKSNGGNNDAFNLGHGKPIEGPFSDTNPDSAPSTQNNGSSSNGDSAPSDSNSGYTPHVPEVDTGLSQEDAARLEAERQAKLPYEAMANQKKAYGKSFKGWEFDEDGYKPIYEDNSNGVQKDNGPKQQQNRVEQNIQTNQESIKAGEGIEVNKIGKDPADKMSKPGQPNSVVGTSVGRPTVGDAGTEPVNFDNTRSYSDQFTEGGFAKRNKNLGLAPESTTNFAEDAWNQGMEQQSNTVVSDKQMKVFIKHCSGDPVMKRVTALIKERM